MKTIYITEAQKGKIEETESKAKSAQDQVHNKVNAGIMDAVTCGGTMEEGAEPEAITYEIGKEKNGDCYHINEEEIKLLVKMLF